jgi:hypothetical protein
MTWAIRAAGKVADVRTAVSTAAEGYAKMTGKEAELKDQAVEFIHKALDAQTGTAPVSVDCHGSSNTQVGAEQQHVSSVIGNAAT